MKEDIKETAQLHKTQETLQKVLFYLKKGVLPVLVILLLLELIVLGTNLIGGEDAVANLPVCIFRIESDSMYPRLTSSDCVLSVKTPFDQIKEGDLITFYSSQDLVTHEVITVNDNGTVTTRGSMNAYDDGQITEAYYVGKVLVKLPFLNVFLKMTDTPLQKAVAITLIIILFFGYDMGMSMINRADKKRKADE